MTAYKTLEVIPAMEPRLRVAEAFVEIILSVLRTDDVRPNDLGSTEVVCDITQGE